jgi:TATA-binding protein-associated factor Taf7
LQHAASPNSGEPNVRNGRLSLDGNLATGGAKPGGRSHVWGKRDSMMGQELENAEIHEENEERDHGEKEDEGERNEDGRGGEKREEEVEKESSSADENEEGADGREERRRKETKGAEEWPELRRKLAVVRELTNP